MDIFVESPEESTGNRKMDDASAETSFDYTTTSSETFLMDTDRSSTAMNDSVRSPNGFAGDTRKLVVGSDLKASQASAVVTERESIYGDTSETKTASSEGEQRTDDEGEIRDEKMDVDANKLTEKTQVDGGQLKRSEMARDAAGEADFEFGRRARQLGRPVVDSFEELCLSSQLLQNIRSSYIERPNDLQKSVLPLLLTNPNRTIYIKSRPHSGKKTSYLINIIQSIDPNLNATQAIIIAPVAELVYYIAESAKDLARHMNIRVFPVTVHDPKPAQLITDHLVVTTLGTYLYLKSMRVMDLGKLSCFVFDEVDLLLTTEKNCGNMRVILERLRELNVAFQLAFFSTSFCDKFLRFAECFGLHSLLIRSILTKSFAEDFLQFNVYSPSELAKIRQLVKLLRKVLKQRIVVYTMSSKKSERVARVLEESGFRTMLVTSRLTVPQRLAAICDFNSSKVQTVLCINYPAGHGISLDEVNVLVNFELPSDGEFLPIEYMHRISVCNTAEDRPAFIYNLTDKYSTEKVARLKNYYKTKMINLPVQNDP